LHQLHRVGLELRRERPSLPFRHEQLLAHLRAFRGVHEIGGPSGGVVEVVRVHTRHQLLNEEAAVQGELLCVR